MPKYYNFGHSFLWYSRFQRYGQYFGAIVKAWLWHFSCDTKTHPHRNAIFTTLLFECCKNEKNRLFLRLNYLALYWLREREREGERERDCKIPFRIFHKANIGIFYFRSFAPNAKSIQSLPSESAQQASNQLNYPSLVYPSESAKNDEDTFVMQHNFINDQVPCHLHLVRYIDRLPYFSLLTKNFFLWYFS